MNQGGETMGSYKHSGHSISKIEQIIHHEIQIITLLAELANDVDNPTLSAVITSMIGDENSHIRLFALLLSLDCDFP